MAKAEPSLEKLIGVEIGGYRIAKLLGQGGMGAVFEATHKTLNLRTAIKVVLPQEQGIVTPIQVQRFVDEARALSEVQHSSLVKLLDVGTLADGTVYMQMELLAGESIAARLARPGSVFALGETIEFGRQMASALQFVHERGIIHRDLKPHNVLVVPDREVSGGWRAKILDFGIAKFQSSGGTRTANGQLLGTPRYMSPEQCESLPQIDDRTDVYSLALLLFEMLTGQSPYELADEQPLSWLYAHVEKRPRHLSELLPNTPLNLERLLDKMLDKMPEQRPTMADVAARLAACADAPADAGRVEKNSTLDAEGVGLVPESQANRYLTNRRLRRGSLVALGLTTLIGTAVVVQPWKLRPPWTTGSPRQNGSSFWPWGRGHGRIPSADEVDAAVAAAQAPSGMAFVPGQTFMMGSTPQQVESDYQECTKHAKDCDRSDFERELKAHLVTVHSYYFDEYEVTNRKYAEWLNLPLLQPYVKDGRKVYSSQGEFILDMYPEQSGIEYRENKYLARKDRESLPVVQVTWFGARKYCESLGHTLPSEAQWELAAHGLGLDPAALPRRWPWGNEPPRCDGVVLAREKGGACEQLGRGAVPVGTSAQDVTPHGIFDLGGNVREWVLDRFVTPYHDCQQCLEPVQVTIGPGNPETGFRVVRGGNWVQNPSRARSASRSLYDERSVAISIGFRCAAAVVR